MSCFVLAVVARLFENSVSTMFRCYCCGIVFQMNALQFYRIYTQYKEYKCSTTKSYVPPELNLIGRICLYLTPGIVIFIFLPACLFSYVEDWDYVESVYFAFVSLSTVGFGDFAPTFQPHQVCLY